MTKQGRHEGMLALARPLGAISMLGVSLLLGCSDPLPKETPPPESAIRRQLSETISPDRLNLVLITIDTLRADRLSCFGSKVQTPYLDKLAADGTRFTNASTTVPFTLPAHSSILTGTYPPFHGVRENVGAYLGDSNRTLAEMLGEAGWQTAGFVSAFVLDASWGIARGFDHYFDDFDLAAFDSPNLGSVQRPGTETIGKALEWLDGTERRDSEKPFFLWIHLYDAHDPYTPPEPYRSRYPGRPYDAEVAYTDSLVGGFMEELASRNLLEESAVVLTSDHGEGLGDHGEAFHGYFVYDSTVHVPLFLRLPGQLAAGSVVNEAVSHVDIVPTLLDLVGLEIPAQVQGRSLLSTLDGGPAADDDDGSQPMVYAESFYPLLHYGWAPLRALRSTGFKYIESPSPELFDLREDPGEAINISGSKGQTTHDMARTLIELAERLQEGATSAEEVDLDEQTLARLQALGYLAGPGKEDAGAYDPRVKRPDPKEKIDLHRMIMGAQTLLGNEDNDEATKLLLKALEADPELLDAHQMLGDLELRVGSPEAAAGHFERALALDDEHRASISGLAASHRVLGNIDEALLGFRRVLDLAGQDSRATLAIADIEVERGDLAAAEQALRAAVHPGAPTLLLNRLGEVQALAGRPEEAMQSFSTAIDQKPDFSQPHFNLAVLYEAEGDFQRAVKQYETAIDKAPKHYQAQFNLAQIVGHQGETQRQIELLEQSIESKPDFAIGHFYLGKALMDNMDLERAEAVTRAGLEIVDDNQFGWFVLADILNRRGQRQEANLALERAKGLSAK